MIQFLLFTPIISGITKRDESYQPELTPEFPHLLGVDRIKSWMDTTQDPCNDFYKYACGGFIKKYTGYRDTTNVMSLMSESNSLLMKQIMNQQQDSLSTTPEETQIFTLTKDYYSSCLDTDLIAKRGIEPFSKLAKYVMQKFDEAASLPQLLGDLQITSGVGIIFLSKYDQVPQQTMHDLRLQLVPAPAYNVTLETVQKIMQIYVKLGFLPQNDLDYTSKWIWGYERRHLYFSKHLKNNNGTDQYMTVDEFSSETNLNWREYLSPLKLEKITNIHLWAEYDSWIPEVEYLRSVDPENLRYFVLWRLALAHFNKLSDEYYTIWKSEVAERQLKMQYHSFETASSFLGASCIEETGDNLRYLSGHIYIKYAFNETQKIAATEMVDNLFSALRSRLLELDWMDETSKNAAVAKLDNIVKIVGYPDWVKDAHKILEYYQPLRFSPDTYFENAVQSQILTEFMPSIRHSRRNSVERDTLFKDHMWQLNAAHLINLVQIQINPGFIQRPLFSALNSRAMNYASLGAVIGHEITHAFDSYGSQFDKDGVRKPWMTQQTREEYNKRQKCFIDEYSQIPIVFSDGQVAHVDGELTITENIADNGGMHNAYKAWSLLETEDIFAKDGDFSPAQIFWLSYAQTNCEATNDGRLRKQLSSDVHSPKTARVFGALINSDDFAKALQIGFSMNAAKAILSKIDLTGKTAVIVGGTAGIGQGIALQLAQLNAKVVLAGRNAKAAEDIIKSFPTNNSHAFEKVDFSLLKDTRRFAENIKEKYKNVDYLVITAGIMRMTGRQETEEGIDDKMAVHYYSRARLILDLIPVMKTGSRVLSVMAAAQGSLVTETDFDLKHSYSVFNASQACPLYNDLLADKLSTLYPNIVFFHSLPGMVKTNLIEGLPWYLRIPTKLLTPFATSIEDCGTFMCSGFLAPERSSGYYLLGPKGEVVQKLKVHTDDLRDKVYQHTLDLIKVLFDYANNLYNAWLAFAVIFLHYNSAKVEKNIEIMPSCERYFKDMADCIKASECYKTHKNKASTCLEYLIMEKTRSKDVVLPQTPEVQMKLDQAPIECKKAHQAYLECKMYLVNVVNVDESEKQDAWWLRRFIQDKKGGLIDSS
ncbi:Endothelin-converting enzyme 2 [Boothiomyces sp. JEL0866]|nr:Endothelin-converting enzyme 2 [Boothiomyces sp. JEL0866]